MAAGISSRRRGDSGSQRAPDGRAAPQRPEGAGIPAPIRAARPVLAANRTDPGKPCSAGAPRPPAALLAGFWAPAHAKCRCRRKDGDQPRSLGSAPVGIFLADPLAQQQTPGCAARHPALLRGPLAVQKSRAERAAARRSGQRKAPPRCESPADLAAEQTASRSPPAAQPGPVPEAPPPAAGPQPPPPDSAPRGLPPAHVGGSATAPRHAHASRSLAMGVPGWPTRAALGALVAIPPLRPRPLPRPALFSHPRCEGRGEWGGRERGRRPSALKGDALTWWRKRIRTGERSGGEEKIGLEGNAPALQLSGPKVSFLLPTLQIRPEIQI